MKATRWRVKGKLKIVLILLFTFSTLFISYQLIYYASLNEYQSEENRSHMQHIHSEHDKHGHTKGDPDVLSSPGGSVYFHSNNNRGGLTNPGGKPVFLGNVLGVAPEYKSLYVRQQQKNRLFFTCFSSGKKISWDKVNDDFCDCPNDGSDEPSTSACMNGRFYCSRTRRNYPEYIPSSRVNDGICDCCDGSDEYDTLSVISCKTRCS